MKRSLMVLATLFAAVGLSGCSGQPSSATPQLNGQWKVLFVSSGEIDTFSVQTDPTGHVSGTYTLENGPSMALTGDVTSGGHVHLVANHVILDGDLKGSTEFAGDKPLFDAKKVDH